MLPRHFLSSVALSERQVLRQQWLRSGQCARCFHASVRRRAGEASNNAGSQYNAPKREPTRQQRAAMISEEVQMLQRDHPSPSFGEPDPNTLRPPGASQTVEPESIGQNVRSGRMGENDVSSQEGLLAQGVGRRVSGDEDVPDRTRVARGARTPHDAVEEPAKGGASVLSATGENEEGPIIERPTVDEEDQEEDDGEEVDEDDKTWTSRTNQVAPTSDFTPGSPTHSELLHGKYSPAIIAGSGSESIIEDRLKTVAEPGGQEHRDIQHLARKMMQGQFVRFTSLEERAAVEELAKNVETRRVQEKARTEGLSSEEVQPSPDEQNYKFRPLHPGARKRMLDKMVAGKYGSNLLRGRAKYKQPILNEIAKMTLRNETYLRSDGDRFLRKVQSLLPAMPTRQTQPRSLPQRSG